MKDHNRGYLSFHKELSELLGKVCSGCGAMGPADEEKETSRMIIWKRGDDGTELWRCSRCLTGNCNNDYEEITEKIQTQRIQTERLKKAENQEENEFNLIWTSPQETVLAPSSLIHDYDGPPFVEPKLSTFILVPQQPPALEMLMGLSGKALEQRTDLNNYVEDILRSPFNTDFGDTFACIYRSLLADVRNVMQRILFGMSSVARSIKENHYGAF